ncbi:MAG TPA: peptidoglycan DD-metalloendopeptidase family protein [Xanthomonadales bacterium]|nr:peptidoglycan DD-metalloendopeptidase family protein [Xanthomonadales bacterium]
MIRSGRLAAILATLALAACTQTVMVNPANQDAPPPAPRSSNSKAPTHEVQAGDTLYKISMQYGVDYRDLAAWNNIAAPYTIYPRQRLRVGTEPANNTAVASNRPAATTVPLASAPVAAAPSNDAGSAVANADAAAATPAPAAATGPQAEGYNAELGVTLPAGAVPIASSTAPASGSVPVFEPTTPATGTTASAASPVSASMPAAEAPLPEVAPAPVATSPSASVPPAAVAASVAPSAPAGSDVAAAKPSAAGWIWPTPGKVVVTYASGDPMRQGIDIAGELGQPVRAARDGEVVYSGAGLIGYGELVIIKHSPELLSAYGHNRVRLVKEGDKIKSGQKIAEMGKNAANRVLLHFEVRKSGKPVDPLPLLPAR